MFDYKHGCADYEGTGVGRMYPNIYPMKPYSVPIAVNEAGSSAVHTVFVTPRQADQHVVSEWVEVVW